VYVTSLPFSRLLGRRVLDAAGFSLGRLSDLAAEVHPTHPRVVGFLLDVDRPRVALIPWSAVRTLEPAIRLNADRAALQPRPLQPDEIALREALVVLWPGLPLVAIMVASQALNGILLPVVLLIMLRLVNDRRLMGAHTNGGASNAIAWATGALLIALSGTLLVLSV
jgi:hypothetical protein